MKEFQFLALKSDEFFDMVEKISRERRNLKCKKRTSDLIKVACTMIMPVSIISYKTEEKNENLLVTRKINFLPVILFSLLILSILEGIIYGVSYLFNNFNILSFIIIGSTWIVVVIFLIYQTFVEVDEINKKLYRVEV